MAAEIVNTLKNRIKENDEQVLHYESLAEDTRKKWQTEARLAEEREVEVLSLQRKIRLLEDRRDKVVDRLEMTTNKMESVNSSLESSDSGRQVIENKYEVTTDKIERLEREVVEAKKIAEESDRRAEEVVRKLVLAEHTKDRAEDRASASDGKIRRLQEELAHLNKGVSLLSNSGEKAAEIDDNVQDTIRELKKKISEAEVRAETSERAALRLQREVDVFQNKIMDERKKTKRAEEDMANLVDSLKNI